MDAVAALLRGLPLQPEESDRGDLMEAKSQLFLKYFTLFMNLLNDCTDVSEIEKEVGARSRVGVAVGVGVGVGAVAVAASRLANLRNSTIQVLDIFLLFNAAQKFNRYLPNFSLGHVESPECQY
jgi:neurofibromin 1